LPDLANDEPLRPKCLGIRKEAEADFDPLRKLDVRSVFRGDGLGARKLVYAVPRHDLGADQVAAFEALGLRAMLWKGRSAPDPTDSNPDQLMCRDTEATFDALEIEHLRRPSRPGASDATPEARPA
jgi:putative DNA primase/helicase